MPSESITEVLIRRDGLTFLEAQARIEEATLALHTYLEEGNLTAADLICEEYFNLEPDYLFDLL